MTNSIHSDLGESENDKPSTKRQRSTWSIEEEDFIIKWIQSHIQNPLYQKRINWQKLASDINISTEKNTFHHSHVNPTSLRECAKRMSKKFGCKVDELRRELTGGGV
jgi:hypothetical protein